MTSTTDTRRADHDVVIVGAGPYGLTAAVHLLRAGVRAQVFGDPMSFWRGMPIGMKLRSNWSASHLVEPEPNGPHSLRTFIAETGEPFGPPVPLRRFIEYGEWVQRRAVPDLDRRLVGRLERDPAGFALTLDDGTRTTARRVVLACGIAPFAHVPERFRGLPPALVSHTGGHRDLSAFAGRRVAIVGGGQSAFECAALMAERGAASVEVIARAEDVVWLRSYSPKVLMGPLGDVVYAPTDVGPLWYSRLVATPGLFRRLPRATQQKIAYRAIRPACSYFVKVRLDEVRVSTGREVVDVEPAGETLRLQVSDGTEREVDHLMLGTGYRVDVSRYPFLGDSVLRDLRVADGYPILRRGLETSIPGLHMIGTTASWSFGPTLRFVSGSWYAGRSVAAALRGRSRARVTAG